MGVADTINDKLTQGNMDDTGGGIYQFPDDISKSAAYVSILEMQARAPRNFVPDSARAFATSAELPRLSLQTAHSFLLPMPMGGLQEKFDVKYNDNFEYAPIAAAARPTSGAGIFGQVQAIATGASVVTGIYTNTFKSITLDSPEFRRFSLRWKFSPQNLEESQELRRIIYRLRKGMTPETIGNKFLFKFPHIYWVGF